MPSFRSFVRAMLPIPCLALGFASATAQVPVVESRFDSGTTEGWAATAAIAFFGSATGGNPGGYLHVDNSEGQVCYLVAPAAFLGDRRAYRGGTLSFDGMMIGTGGAPWSSSLDYGHVFISNGPMQMVADLAPPQPLTTQYTTYTKSLQPADWGVSAATFEAILANVTELRISVEALFGAEIQAIDNVILAPGASPASVAPLAPGCPSSGGANLLAATTLPWIGTTFQATASGLPSPAFAVVAFGLQPVAPALPLASVLAQGVPGCHLHVSPDLLVANFTTSGALVTQLVLPNAPALAGAKVYQQVIPIEVDAALHFVAITATIALELTIGAY